MSRPFVANMNSLHQSYQLGLMAHSSLVLLWMVVMLSSTSLFQWPSPLLVSIRHITNMLLELVGVLMGNIYTPVLMTSLLLSFGSSGQDSFLILPSRSLSPSLSPLLSLSSRNIPLTTETSTNTDTTSLPASFTECPHLELISHLRFNETPECACFAPTDLILPHLLQSGQPLPDISSYQSNIPFLIIGLRDVPYLLYLSIQTLQTFRVSLNEHDWDTHVSFAPLALSLSHHGKYLAVATDKDLHIVYQIGTNHRIRILAGGHQCDSYGKPKLIWDQSDLYLYCNSQHDYLLHIYSLTNGKEIQTKDKVSLLNSHKGQIRDICAHPINRRVLTTSFDRSIIEWWPKNEIQDKS
jgi:hypothetical protein